MAKISARGATKVETIESEIREIDGSLAITVIHTLCSDGRILRKYKGIGGTSDGYREVAKIKKHVPDKLTTFRAYVRRYEAARS